MVLTFCLTMKRSLIEITVRQLKTNKNFATDQRQRRMKNTHEQKVAGTKQNFRCPTNTANSTNSVSRLY